MRKTGSKTERLRALKFLRSIALLCLVSFSSVVFLTPKAQAVTFGDAALTVAVTSGAGAILGASTLPFYGEPDKHKKNIFYGASFGAIIGVLVAAYAGFEEGSKAELEEAAMLNSRLLYPEASAALVEKPTNLLNAHDSVVWAQSATVYRF